MALPLSSHFFETKGTMDHSFCSCGFVSRPMRVREFSRIRSEVSTGGALIRFRSGGLVSKAKPLPFSAEEKRLAIVEELRGVSDVCSLEFVVGVW